MFMAADVSSLVRMLSGCSEKPGEVDSPDGRRDLITRDLLGGSAGFAAGRSKELDLDLKVPVGWEKRLDLVSGEVFFQRSSGSSSNSAAASSCQNGPAAASRRFQDLNLPPQLPGLTTAQPSLDLMLFAPSTSPAAPAPAAAPEYRSVCTLDKVKSALDRLAAASPVKKPPAPHHHHQQQKQQHHFRSLHEGDPSVSPTSSSTTASSLKPRGRDPTSGRSEEEGESRPPDAEGGGAAMVAAGCPSCLSYVLISRKTPRCPRCGSAVPLMPAPKKPRLDLNLNFRN